MSCAGELARGGEAGIAAHMSLLQPARQQPSRCVADRLARLREQGEKRTQKAAPMMSAAQVTSPPSPGTDVFSATFT